MKVREVLGVLKEYNPEAEVKVIDGGYVGHGITLYGYGSSEGCTKANCEDVSFIFTEVEPNNEK